MTAIQLLREHTPACFIRAAKLLDDEAGVPKYLRKHHNMVMLFTYVLAGGISIQHISLKNFKVKPGQFQTSEGPVYYLQLSNFLVKGGVAFHGAATRMRAATDGLCGSLS